VTVRVGLVDDHRVLRDGLRAVIEESEQPIEVALEASRGKEALNALERSKVDVLVLDIAMPGLDGFGVLRRLRDASTTVRTIVLTMYADTPLIVRAIRLGAWGYILKDNAAATIVEAIIAVSRGNKFFDSCIPESVIENYAGEEGGALTPRQTEVLRLICEGRTEREIAEELGISSHTAHAHKNNIMRKLNIHSKVALVRYALDRKLVQL
jgi:DNA-binding NarL/FixJ family response regulator